MVQCLQFGLYTSLLLPVPHVLFTAVFNLLLTPVCCAALVHCMTSAVHRLPLVCFCGHALLLCSICCAVQYLLCCAVLSSICCAVLCCPVSAVLCCPVSAVLCCAVQYLLCCAVQYLLCSSRYRSVHCLLCCCMLVVCTPAVLHLLMCCSNHFLTSAAKEKQLSTESGRCGKKASIRQ